MRRPAQRMKERSKEYTVLYIHFDRVVQNSTEPNRTHLPTTDSIIYGSLSATNNSGSSSSHTQSLRLQSIERTHTHRRGMKRKRMNAEFSGRQKQRENNQSREKVVGFKWFFSAATEQNDDRRPYTKTDSPFRKRRRRRKQKEVEIDGDCLFTFPVAHTICFECSNVGPQIKHTESSSKYSSWRRGSVSKRKKPLQETSN